MRHYPVLSVVAFASLSVPATGLAQRASDIAMFPLAERGMQRVVIRMPPRRDEMNWRVEFFAGREMRVDCNRTSLGQNMASRELTGWGYNFWVVDGTRRGMSTMMGCPPGSDHLDFVSGLPNTEPYNSRLPIVIYVPIGFQVRYRMWNVVSRDILAPPG
jgi:ecotin